MIGLTLYFCASTQRTPRLQTLTINCLYDNNITIYLSKNKLGVDNMFISSILHTFKYQFL